ncbi:septum site-determining protein MinC [Caldicellulosiruptoraceae bacterium PP1]
MNDAIIMKGFNKGIAIVLNPVTDFNILCEELKNKVISAKNLFSGNEVPIQFIGRRLTSSELFQLIEIMKTFGGMHEAIFLWNELNFQTLLNYKDEINVSQNNDNFKIFKGTVRSGQVVESNGDLIVIGDVNPGAQIMAINNVFVLGALRGVAHAGLNGNSNAIVFALELNPVQIRIANVIARSPDYDETKSNVPEVAYIQDNMIVVKSIYDLKNQ